MKKKAFSFVSLTFLAVVLISVTNGYGQDIISTSNGAPPSTQAVFEPLEGISGAVEGGAWSTNAPVPVPNGLSQSTTVANEGLLYTIGGGTGPGPDARINQVWSYDPSADEWTRLSDIPVANGIAAFGAAAVYQGYIYVFGGVSGGGPAAQVLNTTYIYDIANDAWSAGADLPAARFGSAVAVIGDKIYVAGGGDTMIRDTLWEYDPQEDTFAVKAPLPTPAYRIHGAARVTDEVAELHAFGGFPQGTTHLIYNALNNTWRTPLTGVPFGVIDPAVVTVGDLIYVLGGIPAGRTQIYNPAAGWSQGPQLPGPVTNTSGDVIDNVLYVIGGFNGTTSVPTNYSLTIE